MPLRVTHTYAVLEVSKACLEEIRGKLLASSYEDQFHDEDGTFVIDMHGIALAEEAELAPEDPARAIAKMLAKLDDEDKATFNFCIRQASA